MELVIDIGNTAVKIGVFHAKTPVETCTFSPDDEIGMLNRIERFTIQRTICSSVAEVPECIGKLLSGLPSVFWMGPHLPVPVTNAYASPSTLGHDRLANACGAYSLYPGDPVLVVDLGTCLKFDYVDRAGVYRGGSIAPGLRMRYRALQTFTARLPLLDPREEVALIGNTTEGSIVSGVQNGMICEMEGLIGEYRSLVHDLKVLVTGGDAGFFIKRFKSSIFAVPSLTLIGLHAILEHQFIHEK
ncbi:MAG: hypothetical protein RLZZ630_1598 [Bacteroidota bacterium]|jgi:type III pantothenate kinase